MKLNRFTIALLAFCTSGAFVLAQAQTPPTPPTPPTQPPATTPQELPPATPPQDPPPAGTLPATPPVDERQTPTPPPDNQETENGRSNGDRLTGLANALGLTEEQRTQVQTIFDDMRQKIETAVEEARTQANIDLQKILSPDQYQKLQDMMESHEHHWKRRHGHHERPERTPPEPDDNATPNP